MVKDMGVKVGLGCYQFGYTMACGLVIIAGSFSTSFLRFPLGEVT
jgi:hypothetical protein